MFILPDQLSFSTPFSRVGADGFEALPASSIPIWELQLQYTYPHSVPAHAAQDTVVMV